MVTPASASPSAARAAARPTVLVTGFDAFGEHAVNPSAQVAQALHRRQVAGCRVVGAQLPTAFGAATAQLLQLLERHQPALVLCLGLTAGRDALQLERVALNRDDARLPDNDGAQPREQPIIDGAPAAYLCTLPTEAMQRAMVAAGVPTVVSQNAGSFVCNHVFFQLLHRLASEPRWQGTRGGFIHLPPLGGQGNAGMPLAQLVHGVRTGLRAALNTPAPSQA
ncbi:pyroglutamyl-peptidase I [Comamonas flocculans]|uniref:Pyrrolidone-carboxylate peptidase n=1 Tax=Comamonas flocculans TaxID=2597701 RepID=A0A5B8RWC1_9BURK|nr:pyroglutamyl-peptidase I [Comamonas flocculans]QEA13810.1 pyroglutamyl-peptidase I [Comamonas flocculans]